MLSCSFEQPIYHLPMSSRPTSNGHSDDCKSANYALTNFVVVSVASVVVVVVVVYLMSFSPTPARIVANYLRLCAHTDGAIYMFTKDSTDPLKHKKKTTKKNTLKIKCVMFGDVVDEVYASVCYKNNIKTTFNAHEKSIPRTYKQLE